MMTEAERIWRDLAVEQHAKLQRERATTWEVLAIGVLIGALAVGAMVRFLWI